MRWQLPVLLVVLCAVAVGANALDDIEAPVAPGEIPVTSILGSTGLVRTPSAEIAVPLKLNGGWHQVQYDADDQDIFSLNVAVMDDLEVGGAHIRNTRPQAFMEDGALDDETVFNAKYRLPLGEWLDLTGDAPEVAVGVFDAADKVNRALYIVATKEFAVTRGEGYQPHLCVSLGFGHQENEVGAADEMFAGRALDGIFGGLQFIPFSSGLLQAEYDGSDYNALLRVFPTNWITLEGGVVDGELAFGATFRGTF